MNRQKKPYNKPGIVLENFLTGELTGTPEMIEKIRASVDSNSEDIFERLKKALGCTYISDMRTEPYCSKAKALLKEMEIDDYSLKELCLSIRNCIKRAPKSTVPGQHRFGF